MTEYRAAIAAADSPEERQRLVDGDVRDIRDMFGLTVPSAIKAAGSDAVQEYESDFSGHEHDFLLHARSEGWDRPLVNDLREFGTRLANVVGE